MKLVVKGEKIDQDGEGRYSVNDMHFAFGHPYNRKPSRFCALDSTKEIIEILKERNSTFSPLLRRRGRGEGGTWVCVELAIKYCMWADSTFYLDVIEFVVRRDKNQIATNKTFDLSWLRN